FGVSSNKRLKLGQDGTNVKIGWTPPLTRPRTNDDQRKQDTEATQVARGSGGRPSGSDGAKGSAKATVHAFPAQAEADTSGLTVKQRKVLEAIRAWVKL